MKKLGTLSHQILLTSLVFTAALWFSGCGERASDFTPPIALSLDIDGTLGRQSDQIATEKIGNEELKSRFEETGIPIGESVEFRYFKGFKDLIRDTRRALGGKRNFYLLITTGGFSNPTEKIDRNEAIANSLRDYLGDVSPHPLYVYGPNFQTFHALDIEEARSGKLEPKSFQNWFSDLFQVYSPTDLAQIPASEPRPSHAFIRDLQLILDLNPHRYPGLTADRIVHLDDIPKSVRALRSKLEPTVFAVNRMRTDKEVEARELFTKITHVFRAWGEKLE